MGRHRSRQADCPQGVTDVFRGVGIPVALSGPHSRLKAVPESSEDGVQEVAKLALLGGGKALEALSERAETTQQVCPESFAGGGEDDVLDAAVIDAWPAADEAARFEAVDEPRDVRAVASQLSGQVVHGQRRGELKQRSRLSGVEVELRGRAEKCPPVMCEQRAQECPGLVAR
jgi:hypothetical protein